MAAYVYELITAAQALAFAPSDTLVFSSTTTSAVSPVYSGSNVTFFVAQQGVTFGAGFTGAVRSVMPAGQTPLVLGSTGADAILGGTGADVIYGGPGTDTLSGGAGSDTLTGGAGNDLFVFGLGQTTASEAITDFTIDDRLAFAITPTLLDYTEGNLGLDASLPSNVEAITSGLANVAAYTFRLFDGTTGVVVYVDSNNNNTAGDRVILRNTDLGQISQQTFVAIPSTPITPAPPPPAAPGGGGTGGGGTGQGTQGTAGADTIPGTDGADTIQAQGGNDSVVGGSGADSIQAGDGADTISDGEGTDTVQAGDGADLVLGGGGNDVLDGGAGFDTISYADSFFPVTVTLAFSTIQPINTANGSDILTGFEAVIGGPGADGLAGSPGNDTIIAGAGADSLNGQGGDDSLSGGDGEDIMNGGSGVDRLSLGVGGVDRVQIGLRESSLLENQSDTIIGWESTDRLVFANSSVLVGSYAEGAAGDYAGALAFANAAISAQTANFVSVAVGVDVYAFADSNNDNGAADDVVILSGTNLDAISSVNFVSVAGAQIPNGATTLPAAPVYSGTRFTTTAQDGNIDTIDLNVFVNLTLATDTQIRFQAAGASFTIGGTGFTYDSDGEPLTGVITSMALSLSNPAPFSLNAQIGAGPPPNVGTITSDPVSIFSALFAGDDGFAGGSGADLIRSYNGDDLIYGGGGSDTLWGGLGNDVIYAAGAPGGFPTLSGSTYLRGELGNDYIIGGAGFDDINGNQGNDTASGGVGDDWVVGGQNNDLLFGDAGGDLVYGNLGADNCQGGDGNDIVRGGQDNDVAGGGAGDDFVSGDKGDDTMTGGAGVDLFHTFGDAGLDLVTDFNLAEGDRVMVDPGTVYTVSQVGADTVIDMTGGGKMILAGVAMSSLTGGWIFGT